MGVKKPDENQIKTSEIILKNLDTIKDMVDYYLNNIDPLNNDKSLFFKFYSGKDIQKDIGEESKFTINTLNGSYNDKIKKINNIINNNNKNKENFK